MIASVLALIPEQFDGVYSGSKSYLLNLSLSLATALAPQKIAVQAVLPGATRTEIWARSGKDVDAMPAEWVMSAEDLVDAALRGLDRGELVTIPALADVGQWEAMQAARLAMAPNLSQRDLSRRATAPAENPGAKPALFRLRYRANHDLFLSFADPNRNDQRLRRIGVERSIRPSIDPRGCP